MQGVFALAVLEGLALLAAAGYLVVEAIVGHPTSVLGALVIAVFAIAGAVLIGGLGYLVARLYPAARSPLVVLQIVFIPVGFSLSQSAGRTALGVPILVLTIVLLYLLARSDSRSALSGR